MTTIDWSKAGKRLRRQQPRAAEGHRNPDWNSVQRRWKDEADYYIDDMDGEAIVNLVDCPRCGKQAGYYCGYHGAICTPRVRAAGEAMLERHGPRFS